MSKFYKILESIKNTSNNEVRQQAIKNGYSILNVYHGTNSNFNVFKWDSQTLGSGDGDLFLGAGFYFTNDFETAETYADRGGKVMTVALKIQNPFMSDSWEHTSPMAEGSFAKDYNLTRGKETSELRSKGHDGVISENKDDQPYSEPYFEYVVYSSNQIKLLDVETYDDEGQLIPLDKRFDVNNPDIRY